MIERVFVAVDDSAPALAALDVAIDLARSIGAELHVATVAEPGREPDVIIGHASAVAHRAGMAATTEVLVDGAAPFERLLAAARAARADLVVVGRSDVRRTGRPYVGSQTEHLLEFTEIPVVVVPEPGAGR